MSNTLTSLDMTSLDSVTGGTGRAPTRSGGSSGGSSSSDAALQASLTGISDSLKSLSAPQANSNNNTMLFLAMAMAFSRPSQPAGVVVVGGGRRGWW